MAAAVELARGGAVVTVFETARVLGGRARRVEINGRQLDNGLHILLGAYRETLRLIDLVSSPGEPAGLLRMPLELTIYPDFRLRSSRLPAPLNLFFALLLARGLHLRERLAAARFVIRVKRKRFRLARDISVSELLVAERQPETVSRLLWHPLCVSALNTPPDKASAQIFLNVLRDSFDGRRSDSDLLLPTVDFSVLFPERAARYLRAHRGSVEMGTTINTIERDGNEFSFSPGAGNFSQVVVAVPPIVSAPCWHRSLRLRRSRSGSADSPISRFIPFICNTRPACDCRFEWAVSKLPIPNGCSIVANFVPRTD